MFCALLPEVKAALRVGKHTVSSLIWNQFAWVSFSTSWNSHEPLRRVQFQLFEKFPSAARFYSVNKLCLVVRFMAFCLQNSCRHLVNNLCFLSTVLLYVLGIPWVLSSKLFVNSVILDVPGRHSINIAVSCTFRLHNSRSTGLRRIYLLNSSRLPFRKHICVEFVFSIRSPHLLCKYIYFLACFSKFLDRHFKKYLFPFPVMKMNNISS